MSIVEELKNRLKKAMDEKNIKAVELSEKTKIPKSSISQYMSGYAKPNGERTYLMSKALGVSEAWLLGFDVPMRETEDFKELGIRPVTTKKYPLLGEIACGEPIICNREYETFVEGNAEMNADFCLIAKGDSMINARIFDGDVVFVQEMPVVDNGTIAAVIVDNEATLKRVYIKNDRIILRPENPLYEDLVYEGEKMNEVRILGRAVTCMSRIK